MTKQKNKGMLEYIWNAFDVYSEHNAFFIEGKYYTYRQLSLKVYGIATLISGYQDKIIGIVAENKVETYASILAVLLCGKTYVILHPDYPKERNENITRQAGIKIILHCSERVFPETTS